MSIPVVAAEARGDENDSGIASSNEEPHIRLWNASEAEALGDMGFFKDQRVELLWGMLYDKFPDDGGEPRPRQWTAAEAETLGDMGFFEGERVELLWGELYTMSPTSEAHAAAQRFVEIVLRKIFTDTAWIDSQRPMKLEGRARPEPDFAVLPFAQDQYASGHPEKALLVVEVSLSTLRFDLMQKAAIYAEMDIPEYWVVDVATRRLEVFHEPMADPAHSSGYSYGHRVTYAESETLAPLAKPDAQVAVRDLLPPESQARQQP